MQKKQKTKFALFASFIFTITLLFSSCFNLFEEPLYNPVVPSVSGVAVGNISLETGIPAEFTQITELASRNAETSRNAAPSNRTAFPVIPSGVTYYAEVTDTNTVSPVTWNGSCDFTNLPAYTISGLDVGVKWKIEIGIKDGTQKILKDTHTMTTALTVVSPVYSHDFKLKPFQTPAGGGNPAGTGGIALEIELESGSEITKCKTSVTGTDEFTPSSNTITVLKTGITSGNYTVDFTFYTANNEIAYLFTEAVNIFDNMTTNTWVRNGGTESSPYLVEETTPTGTVIKCKITNDMVKAFKLTTFYVKYDGDPNGTGTYFDPIQSIGYAIQRMFDKDLDYRIIVMGSYSGTVVTLPTTFKKGTEGTYHAKSLTICGYDGLDENGIPQNVINGLGKGVQDVFICYSNVPTTIKNLKITNGDAGILLNSQTDITLADGAYITGNNWSLKGSAGFSMKGSAYIKNDDPDTTDNAIYFANNIAGNTNRIKITGRLTKHSSTDKIKIIPRANIRGDVIAEADGTNVTDLTQYKDYFTIANIVDSTYWYPCISADKSQIYINTPFYVSGIVGNNGALNYGYDLNTGTINDPWQSLDRVCEAIQVENKPLDYLVFIDGTVTGDHTIKKSGSLHDIDLSLATSITIKGYRGPDNSDNPQDGLQGDHTPLTYNTDIPLHLQDIFITGGTASGLANERSTIYIESGTVIENNSTEATGGGVLNSEGTLYMSGGVIRNNHTTSSIYGSGGGMIIYDGTAYIYGDAVIGNKNATSYSNPADPNYKSNYSLNGGGLCVDHGGVVYIGYKPDGSVDENFTGGIYYNSADSMGGGIYVNGINTAVSKLYIAGGEIAYNTAKNGAGIASSQYAEIYISGALIKENMIAGSTTGKGGAINSKGLLSLSDSAYIPGGVTNPSTHVLVKGTRYNDIYLGSSDAQITIAGKLTPPDGSDGIIGSITPNAYTDGSTVVALRTSPAPSPSTTIAEASACFEVNPYVDTSVSPNVTTPWYMSSTGTIMDAVPVSSLTSAPASGTKVAASSQADLTQISTWVKDSSDGLSGVTVKLASNITLNSEWAGIGKENTYTYPAYNGKDFHGDFDGNNKEITFSSATSPLFFQLNDANVKDLVLRGSITGANVRGALATTAKISTSGVTKTISNVVNYCNVSNTNLPNNGKGVGGLIGTASSYNSVGTVYTRSMTIVDCVNYGNISGARYVGGIVGEGELVTFRNCESYGNITATSEAGGIAGIVSMQDENYRGSVLENCCVAGTIKSTGAYTQYDAGTAFVGGITNGSNVGSPYIFNCMFAGTIDTSAETVTNSIRRGIARCNVSPNLVHCYFVGSTDLKAASEADGAACPATRLSILELTDSTIAELNDTSAFSGNSYVVNYGHASEYRQWEMGDNYKPRLVRP